MADKDKDGDIAIHRELASHGGRLDQLEAEIKAIAADVREIRDTISGAKGSWKMLVAIVGLFTGAIVMLANKLWAFLTAQAG